MIGIQPGSLRSAVHVILQIAFVVLIYISGILYPRDYFLFAVYILLILLALWAMYTMKFRFNISPEPFRNVKLVSEGPYSLIRHPMYTSLLGMTLCLVVDSFSYARAAYWVLLAANMFLKMSFEEKILSSEFPEYQRYIKRTKRLIPFIL